MRNPLIITVILAAPLCAQLPTDPAKQLDAFEPLLGVFEGSGESRHEPGGDLMKWRARSTIEKVLDGHFVRDHTVVDFAPAMPTPIVMDIYYGYDKENEKLVAYEVSNMGRINPFELGWDGKSLVLTASSVEDGLPQIYRTVMRVDGDTLEFRAEHAKGAGEFFTHVWGTLKRVAIAEASTTAAYDTAFVEHQDPAHLAKLSFMCGKWRMTGSMKMQPGAPAMQIAGTETVTPVWGGTVLRSKVVGDPMEGFVYEAINYIAWNPNDECYDMLALENMGGIWSTQAHLRDGNLVMCASGKQMGIPSAGCSICVVEDGLLKRAYSDVIWAGHEAERVFEGEYEKLR